MRQSKFTDPQIVEEADGGRPVNEIWRKCAISSATYYKWKPTYGGLEASDLKRLRELEHENSRLKRLYAELSLENAALKDLSDPRHHRWKFSFTGVSLTGKLTSHLQYKISPHLFLHKHKCSYYPSLQPKNGHMGKSVSADQTYIHMVSALVPQ